MHLGVLGDHFGVILVIKWVTDAPRGTLNGPRVDFHRFFVDFGSPIGDPLGSLFCIFCDLRYQKACLDCRSVFDDFLMENMSHFDVPTSQKHSKYNGFH